MNLSRRGVLAVGGLLLADRLLIGGRAGAATLVDIEMRGNAEGSRVWFDPVGVLIRPGDTIRWTSRDAGNSHTATAYHPGNDDHPLRIPAGALPWDSDYLLPDESFSVTLTVSGVYDYYCKPHEHAGMVGRIVVMEEGDPVPDGAVGQPVPGLEADPFPPVAAILREKLVRSR